MKTFKNIFRWAIILLFISLITSCKKFTSVVEPQILMNIDPNAKAYIVAEKITDTVAISAINNLVKDLKAINAIEPNFVNFDTPVNSNRKAIYIFPGLVASENKRNLINPLNTDNAKRLVFLGRPDISSKGVKFTTGTKANTKINSSTELDFSSNEIDYMISEDTENATVSMEVGSGDKYRLGTKTNAGLAWINHGDLQELLPCGIYVNNTFMQLNKLSNSIGGLKIIRNMVTKFTNTSILTGELNNAEIMIGSGYAYPQRRFSWASIGGGISSSVADSMYLNAIERYQYTMGRLNLFNILIEGHSMPASRSFDSVIKTKLYDLFPLYSNSDIAVSSSTMVHVNSRLAIAQSHRRPTTNIPFKNIMILWIGTNAGFSLTEYNSMKTYALDRINEGWTVCIITGQPRTSGYETERKIFNNNIRADFGTLPKSIVIDTDLIPQLSDPTNTTYYADGLHPTATGYGLVADAIVTKLVEMFLKKIEIKKI